MSEAIIYPLESSLLGNNTIYRHCEHIDGMKNYAICLNTIKAFNEGRRKPDDLCSKEIKNKTCPALKMRQEEIEAGHALYYVPRVQVEVKPVEEKFYATPERIKCTDSYRRGYASAGAVLGKNDASRTSTPRQKVAPIVKSAPKSDVIDAGSMAAVVSQMVRDHSEGKLEIMPEKIEKKPDVKQDAIPEQKRNVETLLEKAKRLRAERNLRPKLNC